MLVATFSAPGGGFKPFYHVKVVAAEEYNMLTINKMLIAPVLFEEKMLKAQTALRSTRIGETSLVRALRCITSFASGSKNQGSTEVAYRSWAVAHLCSRCRSLHSLHMSSMSDELGSHPFFHNAMPSFEPKEPLGASLDAEDAEESHRLSRLIRADLCRGLECARLAGEQNSSIDMTSIASHF